MKEKLCITIESIRRKPNVGFFVFNTKHRPAGKGAVAECILLDSFFTENLSTDPFEVKVEGGTAIIEARKRTSEAIISAYNLATNSHETLFDGEAIDSTFEDDVCDIVSNKQDLIVPAALRTQHTPFFLLSASKTPCFKASVQLRLLVLKLNEFPDFIAFERKHQRNLMEDYYREIIQSAQRMTLTASLKIPFISGEIHGLFVLREMQSTGVWDADTFYFGGILAKGAILERQSEAPHPSGIMQLSRPIAKVIELQHSQPLSPG